MTTAPAAKLRLETFPARRLLAMRHIGPYPTIGKTWDKFTAWLRAKKLDGQGWETLGLYWDDPSQVPADQLRSDAAIALPEGFSAEGFADPAAGVQVLDLPGGSWAVYEHRGPYDTLGEAWASMEGRSLAEAGLAPADGPCLEIYRNEHGKVAPEDLLTDLCWPAIRKT
jgi:AraC family transcriptional regulator